MKKRIILYTLSILLLLPASLFARDNDNKKGSRNKALIVDGDIHANNVKGILANNGWLFWGGGASGFITPSPVFKSNDGNFATVFASGLWLVGTVDGQKRAAIANYSTDFIGGLYDEYKANPAANGVDNPDYVIYYHYSAAHIAFLNGLLAQEDQSATQKIHTYANEELAKAALQNPLWTSKAVPQGAIANPPGDVAAFTVYHDAHDPQRQAAGSNDSKTPMNIQIRMLAFAFRSSDAVNNAVFIKFEFINKNTSPITDMYATVWSDPDVGQFSDDLVGSDRGLGLGYAYNGSPVDAQYTSVLNLAPPAVGYDYFQGPVVDSPGVSIVARSVPDHDLTVYLNNDASFIPNPNTTEVVMQNKYVRPGSGFFYFNNGEEAGNADEYYNFAQNLFRDGSVSPALQTAIAAGYVDTTDNIPDESWFYNGDPTAGTGWLDNGPDDRRFILNNGPFTLGVSNGTQVFGDPGYNATVFGVFTSFGSNNLTSVAVLKFEDQVIQNAFENAFKIRPAPPAPIVTVHPNDKKLLVNWKNGTKVIAGGNTISTESYGLDGYKFQGYQVVQFTSAASSNTNNFRIYATYDVPDGIRNIEQPGIDLNTGGIGTFIIAKGTDAGVSRSIDITEDLYNNRNRLLNNNFYSIGVRAYYYNANPPNGFEKGIFSDWASGISSLSPRLEEIGTVLNSTANQTITVNYTNNAGSDGLVWASVFDPYQVTGDSYEVAFDTIRTTKFHNGYPGDSIPAGELGWFLKKNGTDVTGLYPQGKLGDEFNYDVFVDGLRVTVTGPALDWKDMYFTHNANGPIPGFAGASADYNGYPGMGRTNIGNQQANGSTWFISTAGNGSRAAYSAFISRSMRAGWNDVIPFDFEMRFNNDADNFGYMAYTSGTVVSVPFELWNASLNIRMIPWVLDDDGNDIYNLRALDHEISGGTNDPQTDWVYWRIPDDRSTPEAGYQAYFANPGVVTGSSGHEVIARTVLVNWNGGDATDPTFPANVNAVMPEAGSILRLVSNKVNNVNTTMTFSGPGAPTLNNVELQKNNFASKLTVFPNPYYGYHAQQNSKDGNFITFGNLPQVSGADVVTVNIYSLAGQKVKTLVYQNNQSTILKWFLTNNDDIKVASGVYVSVISFKSVSVIKKLLIFQGEQRLKTF